MNKEKIIQTLHPLLNNKEIDQFTRLQKIISILNKSSNLTRLIDGNDYWVSQIYDSVWPFLENSKSEFNSKKYIDIGSGCGFPGLAYAITHPDSEVFLIDSSTKKTDALKQIVTEMNLENQIQIINDRIENIGRDQNYRNKFDIGTARAVAKPSTLAEYLIPILNQKGKGILYCGKWDIEEQRKLENSLKILNASIHKISRKILPAKKGERNIIFIQPNMQCPDIYPRRIGKPSKYPLGN